MRMLGRFESPGCCPGTRQGWRRRRHGHSPDCSGAETDPRRRKRAEQRAVRAEVDAGFYEDDESVEDVVAAFERGEQGLTRWLAA